MHCTLSGHCSAHIPHMNTIQADILHLAPFSWDLSHLHVWHMSISPDLIIAPILNWFRGLKWSLVITSYYLRNNNSFFLMTHKQCFQKYCTISCVILQNFNTIPNIMGAQSYMVNLMRSRYIFFRFPSPPEFGVFPEAGLRGHTVSCGTSSVGLFLAHTFLVEHFVFRSCMLPPRMGHR